MTVEEAWNRGNNLVSTAILAIAGIAFFPDTFTETELLSKSDEIGVFLLGLIGIWWYKSGNHRYTRSAVPVFLTVLALVIKVAGVFIEIKDKADVGDDFGGLVLFACATIFVLWLYARKRAPEA